jgi:hypothetical protein
MCVLRVSGKEFDPEAFLGTSALKPCAVFKAGEPQMPFKPDGHVHTASGFSVAVSNAGLRELREQISDACLFLEQHANELRTRC